MDFNGCLPSLACPNVCISPNQTCSNFTCLCSSGYHLDKTMNECLKTNGTTVTSACDSSPCFHGGTCVVNGNGFTCQCVGGYIGMWQSFLQLMGNVLSVEFSEPTWIPLFTRENVTLNFNRMLRVTSVTNLDLLQFYFVTCNKSMTK